MFRCYYNFCCPCLKPVNKGKIKLTNEKKKNKKDKKTTITTSSPPASQVINTKFSSPIKLNFPSSPSQVKTDELTDIYYISADETSLEDVLAANGYHLETELGKGSFGAVYRARDLYNNIMVACKVIDITNATRNHSLSVKNELFILESVSHPHIIKLYKHFIIESEIFRRVYIFMQLAKANSLSVYVRSLKVGLAEPIAKKMFAQIVSAINHLHQNGIAHRDIKMGNVLLNENYDCLVTDFGLSRIVYRESKGGIIMSNKFCGTMSYMAPEIILTRNNKLKYDPFPADIWALGVLLYCMINRGYPFASGSKMLEQQMLHKIRFSKKIQFEPGHDLVDLLNRMLEPNAEIRLTMKQLMKHLWIIKEINIIEKNLKVMEDESITARIKSQRTMWAKESFVGYKSKKKKKKNP